MCGYTCTHKHMCMYVDHGQLHVLMSGAIYLFGMGHRMEGVLWLLSHAGNLSNSLGWMIW